MAGIFSFENLDPRVDDSLEINKLMAQDEWGSVDTDILDKVTKDIKDVEESKEKAAEVDETTSDTLPSETGGSDEEPPVDEDPLPEDAEAGEAQQTVAAETLRHSLVLENYYEGSSVLGRVSNYALGVFKDLAVGLKDLSVEYGPVIFKKLKVGVAYVLNKSIKAMFALMNAAAEAKKRYSISMTRHANQINKIKVAIEELKKVDARLPEGTDKPSFINEKVIGWAVVDNKVDFPNSSAVMKHFIDTVLSKLDGFVSQDIDRVQQIIDYSSSGTKAVPAPLLETNLETIGLRKQPVNGYVSNSDYVDTLVYPQNLPNKTLLIAFSPKKQSFHGETTADSIKELQSSYQASSLFLGVSGQFMTIKPIHRYMELNELSQFVASLEALVALGVKHTELYMHIERKKDQLETSFKNYYNWLVGDKDQKSMEESLAEVVLMKQSFITKVYLPAAIDIHQYLSQYLTNAQFFVNANLKVLSENYKANNQE